MNMEIQQGLSKDILNFMFVQQVHKQVHSIETENKIDVAKEIHTYIVVIGQLLLQNKQARLKIIFNRLLSQ